MKIPVIAALLAIYLGGCAAASVSQQTRRNFDGFTIVPPQGTGWFVAKSGDWSVLFVNKSGSDSHKMGVAVQRAVAPKAFSSEEEFLQYVNDSFFTADPHFYEFLVKEASLNPKHGDFCVEYRYKYKDYKSLRPKSAPFLLHEGHCFLCLHPNAREREYNICYSEIFAPGEEDFQFRVAGDVFIDGIVFTEPESAKPGAKNPLRSISAELADNKNRIFYLSQYNNPLYRVKVELDGEKVSVLSRKGFGTARCRPGRHTLKAHFGIGETEKPFDLVQDSANYFIIRMHPEKGSVEIIEVAEYDWKLKASNTELSEPSNSIIDNFMSIYLLLSPLR